MIVYLSAAQLLDLHREQIRRYGGLAGLRGRGALEPAAARPAMTSPLDLHAAFGDNPQTPVEPSLVFRACAIWLLLLAASPVTFPYLTYDPSAPVHDSTPAADASKLKPAAEVFATIRSPFSAITGAGHLNSPLTAGLSTGWLPQFASPVLRI